MADETALRNAIRQADHRLSKFNPLARILAYDDFDEGVNGWCELVGNHDGDLNKIRPIMSDLRPAQVSNCTFFDIGTHGSMDGTYALKLATRARPGHVCAAIKRLTYAKPSLVQLETWFTYKAEQTFGGPEAKGWDGNVAPSERLFGDFTISNDICEGERGLRYHCALRYANTAADGSLIQKWMYKTSIHTTTRMGLEGKESGSRDFHVQNEKDWKEVPGGHQPMCYNETATKVNWHYLRWLFDTRARCNTELQVNHLTMDLRSIAVPFYEHGYRSLDHLLNFLFDVRTHKAVRNFLYLDSVLISADW